MAQMFYTTGYTGKNVEELKPLVSSLNACLVDIRFSPTSRHLKWTQNYLMLLLKNKYRHVPALGNRTFKENKITIQNLELGIKTIQSFKIDVILLCGCKDLHTCHRYVVMNELLKRGEQCDELSSWSAIEAKLF